jgi:hypothetical protein
MPYCDELEAIFLHVPRTGGTAIKRMFGIHQLDSDDASVVPSPQHLTCELLRLRVGSEKYERYYRFAFVRNPWARLLSTYRWRRRLPKKRAVPPFPEFVRHVQRVVEEERYYEEEFGDHFIPQVQYTLDVHDVFRHEAFGAGVHEVAERLGVKVGALPSGGRQPRGAYWEHYDDQTRSVVFETYRDEIERFAYVFGE